LFNQVGPLELVVVLGIVLLVFGPKRLPQAGRALGKSMREFKDSISGRDDDAELDAPATKAVADEPAEKPQPMPEPHKSPSDSAS
jgi:sec-independent protein translocase protein TatA